MNKFSCAIAKQIDIIDYRVSLGNQPNKIKNKDHKYFSPLRREKEPTFGGCELRNTYFKWSSSPKDITELKNQLTEKVSVFQGFFNFLSFQSQLLANKNLLGDMPKKQGNFLALKSLSFFEKAWKLMEKYRRIHPILDMDTSGLRNPRKALAWSIRYIDESLWYKQ